MDAPERAKLPNGQSLYWILLLLIALFLGPIVVIGKSRLPSPAPPAADQQRLSDAPAPKTRIPLPSR